MSTSEYSCREKSHGWSTLVGYNPKGHKALDMTELLRTSTYINQVTNKDLLYSTRNSILCNGLYRNRI